MFHCASSHLTALVSLLLLVILLIYIDLSYSVGPDFTSRTHLPFLLIPDNYSDKKEGSAVGCIY